MKHESKYKFPTPVGFLRDGTAVTLVLLKGASLLLWDVRANQGIRRFTFTPTQRDAGPFEFVRDLKGAFLMTMTADASCIAAVVQDKAKNRRIAIWKEPEKETWDVVPTEATALALSSTGDLLATGDKNGRIVLRSVPQKKELVSLPRSGSPIRCLALSPDARCSVAIDEMKGRLASGEHGGIVSIWDLQTRRSIQCRAHSEHLYTVTFSPDGTLLACGGHFEGKIWDGFTGESLLNFTCQDVIAGLAFAPDGKTLAICNILRVGPVTKEAGIELLRLEDGHGTRTLRGLSTRVARVCYSANDRFLAALSEDWKVAVWDLERRRLQLVLDVPKGIYLNHAALALSHDGRHLAFCTSTHEGGQARMWSTLTGNESRWPILPPAFNEDLAFDERGRLLLSRIETRDGKKLPASPVDVAKNPSVWRVRDLLAEPVKLLIDNDFFNAGVTNRAMSNQGRYFVLDGVRQENGQERRLSRLFSLPDERPITSSKK